MSVAQPASGLPNGSAIERALALLEEALGLLDSSDAPSELGARVQEAIDALDQFREAPQPGSA